MQSFPDELTSSWTFTCVCNLMWYFSVELQSLIWWPKISCLHSVRTCFSVACPCSQKIWWYIGPFPLLFVEDPRKFSQLLTTWSCLYENQFCAWLTCAKNDSDHYFSSVPIPLILNNIMSLGNFIFYRLPLKLFIISGLVLLFREIVCLGPEIGKT